MMEEILIYPILFVIFIILIFVIRTLFKDQYQFKIGIMSPGVNEYFYTKGDQLTFDHEVGEGEDKKTLKIRADCLYEIKPSRLQRIIFFLKRVNSNFIIIFKKDSEEPLTYEKASISTRILWEVNESRALDQAVKDEFKIPMNLKNVLIIFGIIVFIVIAYYFATGQVKLS